MHLTRIHRSRFPAFALSAAIALAMSACVDQLPTQSHGNDSPAQAASVAGTPVITQDPVTVHVNSGDRYTLAVTATGTAPLTYQWLRNRQPVAGLTGASFNKIAVGVDSGAEWICIVTNSVGADTSAPAITHIKGQVREAESATLFGAVAANDHPGYSGTGFADYINASNDYVEWKVTLANPAAYLLEFRFANGSGSARNLKITVNGVVVNGALAFPSTGSWSTWTGVRQTANLIAGTNTIRATATGTSGPNVDFVYVW